MKSLPRLLVLSGLVFAGCETAHDVAVTSWRVIDAPARYVRRHIEGEPQATTTTTTTRVDSDAVTPGHPVDVAAERHASPSQRRTNVARTGPTPRQQSASTKPSSTPARSGASQQQVSLPTAKPVPDKPGYVFSPFDPNGGYVDVNGYASGQKVKDPYSGKIFLVP